MSRGEGLQRCRSQAVFIRPDDEVAAMAWNQRLGVRFKNLFSKHGGAHEGGEPGSSQFQQGEGDEEASNEKASVQYRLESGVSHTDQNCFRRWFGSSRTKTGLSAGVNPNQKLAMYLHWMFRVNFLFLFVVMCVTFFGLVILFSGFIAFAGRLDHQCVRVGSEGTIGSEGTPFADAFALSWTTFSTVGYGSTYPALGSQNESNTNCFFINFICSLESLLGVLYSGFCGAILFGKVLRIQSHAQVIFSDPLVVRYGYGLLADFSASGRNNNATDSSDDDNNATKIPCPVLEFRIVNRLFNELGGEIMDASLNVVANINADDADPALRDALEGSGGDGSNGFNSTTSADSASEDYASNPDSIRSMDSSTVRSFSRFLAPLGRSVSRRDHQAVDEDPSARFVNKHVFSKMMIEACDHPFFKRVWLARHVLDEHSPLLKHRVRRSIRRNGGSWPDKLNNYHGIRESLQFNQILVSLNGVSNISASDVYAQKIYDFVDINIGYQFVNILYRDSDGTLGVDTDLINDVREQNGGGGEPLILEE